MLYIISGPSSVGKSIIVNRFIDMHSYKRITPYTSRSIRENEDETDGIEYFFRTKEQIKTLSVDFTYGYWDWVFENVYGYSTDINKSIHASDNYIILATTKIALSIKKDFPVVKTIFIDFESDDELKKRISDRFKPNQDFIASKLENAKEERMHKQYFDLLFNSNSPIELYEQILRKISI